MQPDRSDATDPSETEDTCTSEHAAISAPSLWDKARQTLRAVSTQTNSVSEALVSKVTEFSVVASAKATGAIETGKQAYTGSRLESAVNYLDGELDQRGVKKTIKDTSGAVVDKLDQVTGKRLVELLEAKLRVQGEYNDILATRLAEALDRIARLEARLDHAN